MAMDLAVRGGTRTKPDWRRLTLLLHGPRKVGKSSCAAQAPQPLFFDAENRLNGIPGPYLTTPTIQQLVSALTMIEGQLVTGADGRLAFGKDYPYRTFIWDGLDRLYRQAYEDAANHRLFQAALPFKPNEEWKNPATKNPQAAHAVALEHVASAVARFHRLPGVKIITAHSRTYGGETLRDANGKTIYEDGQPQRRQITVPDLAPKVLQLVEDTVDVSAYCYFELETNRRVCVCSQTNTAARFISAFDSTGVLGEKVERNGRRAVVVHPLAWESLAAPLRALMASAEAQKEDGDGSTA